MKKLSIFLMAVLLLCVASMTPASAEAPFSLVEEGTIAELQAESKLYEHTATGARVLFILNDDVNRGFGLGFQTEPWDDSGVFHVLEHTVMASSDAYPGKSVFFDAQSQTYQTYMNAVTSNRSTSYFASSLSEAQLLALADYYLDSAFHPTLLNDANYFAREGWRYEMASADQPITVNGVIYNEERAIYETPSSVAVIEAHKALFPDTYQGYDAGGAPQEILSLTYADYVETYGQYYHPSNSLAVVYGDVDVDSYLDLLDRYYGQYDAMEVKASPSQTPLAERARVEIAYPVSAELEGQVSTSLLLYAWALEGDASFERYLELGVLAELLNDESLPFMQTLRASELADSFQIQAYPVGDQMVLACLMGNAKGDSEEAMDAVLEDALSRMIAADIPQETIDSVLKNMDFAMELTRNASDVASSVVSTLRYALDCNDLSWFYGEEALTAVKEKITTEAVNEWLQAGMLDNTHAARVQLVPTPGLLEEEAQAQNVALTEIRNGMDAEAVAAFLAEQTAFNAWNTEADDTATIEKLTVVDSASIPLQTERFETQTLAQDGLSVHAAQVDGVDVSYTCVQFDASGLSLEELHGLQVYLSLLGNSTESLADTEVSVRGRSLLYQFQASLSYIRNHAETDYTPVVDVSFYAANDTYDEAVALVRSMLTETQVPENMDKIEQSMLYTLMAGQSAETIYGWMQNRTVGWHSEGERFTDAVSGLSYYTAIPEMGNRMTEDADAFAALIAGARDKTFGGIVNAYWAGDLQAATPAALATLGEDVAVQTASVAVEQPGQRMGIATQTTNCYVVASAAIPQDTQTNAALLVAQGMLENEYLIPQIRMQNGAYFTGMTVVPERYMVLTSYRDTDFGATLSAFSGLGAALKSAPIDEAMLERYKLSAITDLVQPTGIFSGAMTQLQRERTGYPEDFNAQYAEAVRAVTVDDLRKAGDVLDASWNDTAFSVVASQDALSVYAVLFDSLASMQ